MKSNTHIFTTANRFLLKNRLKIESFFKPYLLGENDFISLQ
jgi:hypothetical protein